MFAGARVCQNALTPVQDRSIATETPVHAGRVSAGGGQVGALLLTRAATLLVDHVGGTRNGCKQNGSQRFIQRRTQHILVTVYKEGNVLFDDSLNTF